MTFRPRVKIIFVVSDFLVELQKNEKTLIKSTITKIQIDEKRTKEIGKKFSFYSKFHAAKGGSISKY